jgi:hypothetical protein
LPIKQVGLTYFWERERLSIYLFFFLILPTHITVNLGRKLYLLAVLSMTGISLSTYLYVKPFALFLKLSPAALEIRGVIGGDRIALPLKKTRIGWEN